MRRVKTRVARTGVDGPHAADVRIFVALEKEPTLTAVAASLQLPLFTVSRAIKRVEHRAGMLLVKRTNAGLRVTDLGRDYLQACKEILDAQAKAEAVLLEHRAEPEGVLRIGAPMTFAQSVLSVILPTFHVQFPKLVIELDLYSSEWKQEPTAFHDIFFKVRLPQHSRHHQKSFPAIRQGLFASPAYLRAHPAPVHPNDLNRHTCVGHSEDGTSPPWNLTRGNEHVPVRPRLSLKVDDPEVQARFALASTGVALLPLWLAESYRNEGRLVPLLKEWTPEHIVFCALHAGRLRNAPKENAFLNYLEKYVGTSDDPRCRGRDPGAFFV